MRIALLTFCVVILVVLCGCNPSQKQTSGGGVTQRSVAKVGFVTEPGCFERSVVRVVLTDQPPSCSVQAGTEERGHQMPCTEVGSYLRINLNPPVGAIVGLTTRGQSTVDSMSALFNSLSTNGFESGGTQCYISQAVGKSP